MKDFFGRVGFKISDFGRKIHTARWALAFAHFPFMALLAGFVLDVVLGYWQAWLGSKKRHVWYVTSVVLIGVVYTDLMSQPHEWFEQEGFDYIVKSSRAYGRFFADPGRYLDQIAEYEALSDHYSLLQTFQGPLMGYPQEEIKVLAVTKP